MIIHSLKLKNYRKYKDELIEFPEGLFGIIGNNGAGKTSLIEAIAWAIYGIKGSNTAKELIKREDADPNADCSVELEFTLESDSCRVLRELRGRRQSAYAVLFVNNQLQAEGINAVTRYLTNKLGMDYNSFFTSIFTKQKELDALSDMTPAIRKKRILKLLRIDSIDVAIKNLRIDKKGSEKIIEGVRATFQDIDELNSNLNTLKKEKITKSKKVKSEKNSVNRAKINRVKAKKLKDLQERKYTRYQSLDKKLQVHENTKSLKTKSLDDKETELKKLCDSKKTLMPLLPKLKSLKSTKVRKEDLDRLREKFLQKTGFEDQIKSNIDYVNKLKENKIQVINKLKKFKGIETKQKSTESKIDALDKELKELLKKVEQKKGLVKEYKNQRKDFKDEFEKIKKLGQRSKCPTCKKVIGGDLLQIIEHFKKEIEKFDAKIKSDTALIGQLCKEHDKSSELLKETKIDRKTLDNLVKQKAKDLESKNSLDKQIKNDINKNQKIQEKIKKIGMVKYNKNEHQKIEETLNRLVDLDRQCISLQSNISRIPSVKKSINALSADLSKVETAVNEVSNSIKSLRFDEETYEKTKNDYDGIDDYFHKKEKDLLNATNELTTNSQEIINTNNQIAAEKKKQKKIKEEENKIEILNALDKIFGEFRMELISRIIPLLSVRASKLFRKITEGKYSSMTLDKNYEILIEDDGKQFPLHRFSGGEEDLASLCLRISISQIIEERTGSEGIHFIVLDEIFGSQDEMRKNNILKSLNDLSSQFRQIIVITHIDDIKDMLPYAFNVIETSDKSSKIISEGTPSLSLTA